MGKFSMPCDLGSLDPRIDRESSFELKVLEILRFVKAEKHYLHATFHVFKVSAPYRSTVNLFESVVRNLFALWYQMCHPIIASF